MSRPQVIADGVIVKTLVSGAVNEAIEDLVAASGGVSKRAILRQIIAAGLQTLTGEAFAADMPAASATPTPGRRRP